MEKIMLVFSPKRQSGDAVNWAVARAKSMGVGLKAACIIDDEVTRDIEDKLAETGFVGDRPGSELGDALKAEFETRGRKVLDGIRKQCTQAGVSFESVICHGRYLNLCAELAREAGVALLVVTEPCRSFLKKLFVRTEVNQIKERVAVDVKSFCG